MERARLQGLAGFPTPGNHHIFFMVQSTYDKIMKYKVYIGTNCLQDM